MGYIDQEARVPRGVEFGHCNCSDNVDGGLKYFLPKMLSRARYFNNLAGLPLDFS